MAEDDKQADNSFYFNFFTFTFYNCIVPMGFLPWEIRIAFPGENQRRQSLDTLPSGHAGCFSVTVVHQTSSDMDYGIFNVRAEVNACDCAHCGVWTPYESQH